jgi:hypothetical protein
MFATAIDFQGVSETIKLEQVWEPDITLTCYKSAHIAQSRSKKNYSSHGMTGKLTSF